MARFCGERCSSTIAAAMACVRRALARHSLRVFSGTATPACRWGGNVRFVAQIKKAALTSESPEMHRQESLCHRCKRKMLVRPYTDADFDALRAMHAAQNVG